MMHHQANSFSMLFKPSYDENDQYHHQMLYPFASPSPSSSVDCTLSLGTPSTRSSSGGDQSDERRRSRGRSGSKFGCWDFLQGKSSSSSGSSNNGSSNGMINSDSLLARRCANCDTTSTPLWRNGPRGPKSLCNACGIRYKKEERRATASSGGMDGVHYTYQNNNSWGNNPGQKMACFSPTNEFRFIDDSDTTHHDTSGGGGGIPFLPWMLNVGDRPTGLVHDFTR